MAEGRVAARYRLERELGRGAMGTVWQAQDEHVRTRVAVKVMHAEAAQHPEARARFEREASLVEALSSPHVVSVLGHGTTEQGLPFLVMDLLEGCTLRQRLAEQGRLALEACARLLEHAAAGLAAAHQAGLVHRDLKPENLFLAMGSGDQERLVILDFGTAKVGDALARGALDPTGTGRMLGTPHYMSPEQAQGLKSVDHRTDLWALGVVIYECLTGMRPFAASTIGPLVAKIVMGAIVPPRQLVADLAPLPAAVDAWFLRALARSVEERFSSAPEMAAAFTAAI